jgi:regulator of RNase E activity RraA
MALSCEVLAGWYDGWLITASGVRAICRLPVVPFIYRRILMRRIVIFAVVLAFVSSAGAQLGLFSREQRIAFTPDWHGDRFPDGRPQVPDAVLQRLKTVSAEEAWDTLQDAGFRNQFDGGWKIINPGERLVGRVVTAVFMPRRPDFDSVVKANGKKENRIGDQNSWIIDILQPGDLLVVDLFGKIRYGTIIGDNLATAIYSKSHNGLIVDGAIRDQTGIEQIKGFQCYVRGVDPSALQNVMLTGINVPIRIGQATVMPGDIAIGDPEGVTFVPPQLAEKVADDTEMTHFVDEWGHMMLREGKYTPGQIDAAWTRSMVEQFNQWLAQKGSKLRMPLP